MVNWEATPGKPSPASYRRLRQSQNSTKAEEARDGEGREIGGILLTEKSEGGETQEEIGPIDHEKEGRR